MSFARPQRIVLISEGRQSITNQTRCFILVEITVCCGISAFRFRQKVVYILLRHIVSLTLDCGEYSGLRLTKNLQLHPNVNPLSLDRGSIILSPALAKIMGGSAPTPGSDASCCFKWCRFRQKFNQQCSHTFPSNPWLYWIRRYSSQYQQLRMKYC